MSPLSQTHDSISILLIYSNNIFQNTKKKCEQLSHSFVLFASISDIHIYDDHTQIIQIIVITYANNFTYFLS